MSAALPPCDALVSASAGQTESSVQSALIDVEAMMRDITQARKVRIPTTVHMHPTDVRLLCWLCPPALPTDRPLSTLLGLAIREDSRCVLGIGDVFDQHGKFIESIPLRKPKA